LDAPGFFQIETPNGVRYTRDGSFTLDSEGFLVTKRGDKVLGTNGPLRIGGGEVVIGGEGSVEVEGESLGRISVVDVAQPELLKKEGGSYYFYEGEEGDVVPSETGTVKQGFLEKSNVNPTEQMIKMVEALRAFESAQKAVQCIDEVTGKLISDVTM
jgi:flagellar basal-body rod protein FlgG